MGEEIERKFLVRDRSIIDGLRGRHYRQGYLSTEPERSVRIRHSGDHAVITIKGRSSGAARAEYEYEIPPRDADELIATLALRPIVEKTRYRMPVGDLTWEIDVFEGANAGLVLAEVELPSREHQIPFPEWLGDEVTTDPRYANASLVAHPFRDWPESNSANRAQPRT